MKILHYFLFIIASLFCQFRVQSQLKIDDSIQALYSVEEKSFVYIDTSNSISIHDIKNGYKSFVPFCDAYRIIKPNTSYWLAVKIKNNTSKTINWVLNFYDPDFKLIAFYDNQTVYTSGVNYPFSSKAFFHKNFVFPIQIKPAEERVFFVRMQSDFDSAIKVHLSSIENHHAYALSEYYSLGIYYGILLILMIYNLILFFHTKLRTYFFYVIYLACAVLFSFNEDGLGFQFLWGQYPQTNWILRVLSPVLLQFSFLLFALSFLELGQEKKKTKLLWAITFFSFFAHFTQIYGLLPIPISYFFYLIPFALLFCITWQKVQKKHSDSIYFLIGNGLILASLIIYYLRLNNWVYSGVFEVYAFNFSVIIEALVLSMAVGNKIRKGIVAKHQMQETLISTLKEKELLSTKVTRELAEKVEQRTQELEKQKDVLEQKNTELLTLKTKLYKMNEFMDLANHKLSKEVQDVTKESILNKEISYEAFHKIYKDQITCLNYLKDLKTERKTPCSNCKNLDFRPKDKHTKQCTKCNKIDSATSNTLFHALKFPLPKAFYLVYIANYSKNKYTLDTLSELLDLGRNTCWSFIKKVELKKEFLTKKKPANQISFDDLIL